ncbi:unnamed protein product [Ilex paraguariensis]|uniref:WIYLD domain-containing protein n=1 Tax=Ilex paraguariensis TaxID=185542 RepID=A0ABC8TF98_9AQUA
MEPRAEIRRACHAMKKYGFHHMTVKAILKELLPAHNYNWELIENDDYTILLDAMFEWKNRNIKNLETAATVQAEHEKYKTQIEDLKLLLKATNEKYESSKIEWEQKELHLMSCIERVEEENLLMRKEANKLANLLKKTKEKEKEDDD